MSSTFCSLPACALRLASCRVECTGSLASQLRHARMLDSPSIDRDVIRTRWTEWRTTPVGPALLERHTGNACHQVELHGPRVVMRDREHPDADGAAEDYLGCRKRLSGR